MRAGPRRHRVAIDMPKDTQDANGAVVSEFVHVGTVWASVEPLKGREALLADQITAEMDARIKVRWSAPLDCINAKWRLRFKGVIYDIKSVAHVAHRHREIEIMCSSGVNRG